MKTMTWIGALMLGAMLGSTPARGIAGEGTALEPGQKAPAFALKDAQGKEHSLAGALDAKEVVVMFIATRCPVSNSYNDRMVALYRDYAPKGIAFLAINSNKQEGVEEIRDHAKTHGFEFPVLKDGGNQVANAYGAQVTPEIFVIDPGGIVRYHGRIDDSMRPEEVHESDLRMALDALLAGKAVPRAETKAFGCSIKRVESGS